MIDIALNSFTLGVIVVAAAALVVALILIVRFWFNRQQIREKEQPQFQLNHRNKYPEVNAFRLSSTFFNVGMTLALGLVIAAFSWTKYDKPVFIPDQLENIEDLEMVPPPTVQLPPPPPNLPPPVIEEVPDALIEEDDQPDFVDNSIDATSFVAPSAPVKKEAIAPPPLPEAPPETAPPIFSFAEEMPRFPGCEDLPSIKEKKQCADQKMLEFVYKNIKYPVIARENGIEGMAVITFVVETNGSVTDARILRDPGGQCGTEALRVVNLMNEKSIEWIPGKQRGRPVRVQFNLPVRFKLE